jgi:putative flippase GtrA
MLWARVLLAVALGVGVLFWPYDARCGAGLAGLLAVIALIVLAGVWSAVWTWRHRAGRLHLVSLAVVLWGLALGAREVLPRTGVGLPSMDRPAIWACQ